MLSACVCAVVFAVLAEFVDFVFCVDCVVFCGICILLSWGLACLMVKFWAKICAKSCYTDFTLDFALKSSLEVLIDSAK